MTRKNESIEMDLTTSERPQEPEAWVTGDGLLAGDAYQEGPYVVFTSQYHLRRGYCCNSGCRHCPYKH